MFFIYIRTSSSELGYQILDIVGNLFLKQTEATSDFIFTQRNLA